jgi:hypothetical protein
MLREMSETRIQPQRMVTDWPVSEGIYQHCPHIRQVLKSYLPSVRVIYMVVERPKGTAMMAKDL